MNIGLYQYRGENHDWDLTLGSAAKLLAVGQNAPDDRPLHMAAFTASMLLAITAVESFTNSLAFSLDQSENKPKFKYRDFRALRGLWAKINRVCRYLDVDPSGANEPFLTLVSANHWRNSLVHTQPYQVAAPNVENTTDAIHQLHSGQHSLEYARLVTRETAEKYFVAAKSYVDLLVAASGIRPLATASYMRDGQELRIVRETKY